MKNIKTARQQIQALVDQFDCNHSSYTQYNSDYNETQLRVDFINQFLKILGWDVMKSEPTSQKLRGGYYTPRIIADFLAQWAIRSPHDTVLEPSCGDGGMLVSAAKALLKSGATPEALGNALYGVELNPQEAARAAQHLENLGISKTCVHAGDFFRE